MEQCLQGNNQSSRLVKHSDSSCLFVDDAKSSPPVLSVSECKKANAEKDHAAKSCKSDVGEV